MASTAQVGTLSILFMCVTLLCCFGGPIALMIWAKVRYKKAFSFVPLLLGAVGFIAGQIIFRQVILGSIPSLFGWYRDFTRMTLLFVIYSCLMAGLVEEPARFAVFSMLKKRRAYPDGLSYGIGHGGIEAMLIVGLAFINNLIYSIAINSGSWGAIMSAVPPAYQSQFSKVWDMLVTYTPDTWLIGGFERLCTLAIQIGFSMIVLRGFMVGKKWLYLGIAILVHALVNFVAVSMQMLNIPMWYIEGAVFVMAVISVLYIIRQARDWRKSLAIGGGDTIEPARQADTP